MDMNWIKSWFTRNKEAESLEAGIYHYQASEDSPIPYRMHLRIEEDQSGVLIINAATVLHLNPTATAHALQLVQGATPEEAARSISKRYRVSHKKALVDHDTLRQQVLTIATNPDVDPVMYLSVDRHDPYSHTLSAPYRLDLALTYTTNPDGELDPLARARVDRELSADEWKQVISTAWDAGIPHVIFTGGEPTRRDDLVELVSYAEKVGQVSGVLTDGRKLADPGYVNALAQAGLDHFLITLLPDVQESIKGLDNALVSEVFTAAHLTIRSDDFAEVKSWMQRLHSRGLTAISISGSKNTESMANLVKQARDLAAELGMELIWDIPAPYSHINPIALEVEGAPSGAGRAWLYVEPDGDVLPGQGIDRILGNMLRDPWPSIWSKAQEERP
jgi:organic radical activating enzyme